MILPTWSRCSTWSYPQGRASWPSLEVLPRLILAVRSVVCRCDTFFLILWYFLISAVRSGVWSCDTFFLQWFKILSRTVAAWSQPQLHYNHNHTHNQTTLWSQPGPAAAHHHGITATATEGGVAKSFYSKKVKQRFTFLCIDNYQSDEWLLFQAGLTGKWWKWCWWWW